MFQNNFFTKFEFAQPTKYVTGLAIVGGTVTDIIQPIAPIALYIFIISSLLIVFFYFFKKKFKILANFIPYMFVTIFISFLIVLFQYASGNQSKGFLASNFDTFESIQYNLGIDRSLSNINENTKETNEILQRIEDKISNLNSLKKSNLKKDSKTMEESYFKESDWKP